MKRWGRFRSCLVALAGCSVMVGLLASGAPSEAVPLGQVSKVGRVSVGSGWTNGDAARLVVRWRPVAGATSYQIFYSSDRDMSPARSARTTRSALAVRGLRADRGYCFRVRAAKRTGGKIRYGAGSAKVCARTPKPVRTARAPWVTAQQIGTTSGRPTTTLTLQWSRTSGATAYEILYAPGRAVTSSPHLRRLRVTGTGTSVKSFAVHALTPGQVYCFVVRGRSATGVGNPSAPHCKLTMPAARALAPTRLEVRIATFNVCGAAATCQVPWGWALRRAAVRQHILDTGADVIAVQEGRQRLADIEADLRPDGFVKACDAAGAQAVFVRSRAYAVVSGSAGGVRFADDRSHGACWVRLTHRATWKPVVVSSLHLYVGGGTAGAQARARQTSQVLTLMQSAYGPVNATGTPPFLLAGDFNSHRAHPSDTPRIRLESIGFHDGYDVSATYLAPYRNSGNGYRPVPVISTLWGSHLDRVFVPPGASVTGWRTVSRISNGRYVAPMPSDHHPVTMTVYLPYSGGLLGLG